MILPIAALLTLTAPGTPAELNAPIANSFETSNLGNNLSAWMDDASFSFYGYVKADASQDSGLTSNGNFARWVETGAGVDESQFNITARQTRLGVSFAGPSGGDISTSAQLEIDFYSGGGGENSAQSRMRQGWVKLNFENSDMELLLGQTSDVVSPLTTPTLNYTVLWWSGDIGFRRNQLRLTKGFDIGDDGRLVAVAAATRSISGEGEGPGLQARLGYTFTAIGGKATVGVSMHSATEVEGGSTIDSDSMAIDIQLPLGDSTSFKGEYFSGENLDLYLGGVGQGTTAGSAIEADGFWFSLTHKASDTTTYNIGYGVDDPEDADLAGGDRSENSTIFANVQHAVNTSTTLGFEVAQHETSYLGGADEDALRLQISAIFKF